MTVAQYEEGRATGQPLELYRFVFGTEATAFIAYCDAEFPYDFEGDTYDPIPIERSGIHSQQSLDKSEMTIKVPSSSSISQLFAISPPSNKVVVIVRRGAVGDPDQEFPVVFTGQVQQTKRNGIETELSCVPSSVSIKRVGLRRHYQYTCPHVLYDQDPGSCRADKAAATVLDRTVDVITGNKITMAAGWAAPFPEAKFLGGLVEWDGPYGRERRTILRVTGNLLTLSGLPTGLEASDTVDVVLGCGHDTEDCSVLHDNIVNFGGMPYIPTENPIKRNPFF